MRIFVSPDKSALPKATDSSAWLACRRGGEQIFAALVPVRAEELALEFTHNFGYRLVKSRVLGESRAIGGVFFTAWNP